MSNNALYLIFTIAIAGGIFLYFLPSILARKKKDFFIIFMINLFFGISGLGWLICLVWAFRSPSNYSSIKEDNPKQKLVNETRVVFNTDIRRSKHGNFYYYFITVVLATLILGSLTNRKSIKKWNKDSMGLLMNYLHTFIERFDIVESKADRDTMPSQPWSIKNLLEIEFSNDLSELIGPNFIKKTKFYGRESNYLGYQHVVFRRNKKMMSFYFSNNSTTIEILDDVGMEIPFNLRLDMPINELLRINTKPISFLGFEHDYDGLITNYYGGKLQKANLTIFLKANPRSKNYHYLIGDKEFQSNNPRINGLNLRIASLSFSKTHK